MLGVKNQTENLDFLRFSTPACPRKGVLEQRNEDNIQHFSRLFLSVYWVVRITFRSFGLKLLAWAGLRSCRALSHSEAVA